MIAENQNIDEEVENDQPEEMYDHEKNQLIADPVAGKGTKSQEISVAEGYTEQVNEGFVHTYFIKTILQLATARTTLKMFANENGSNAFRNWNVKKLAFLNVDSQLLRLSNFLLFQLQWKNDYQSLDRKEKPEESKIRERICA